MIQLKNFRIKKFCFYREQKMNSMFTFTAPTIGYLLKGHGKFVFPDGSEKHAGINDLIYIPKGTIYMSTWTGNPDIEFYSISYTFDNQYKYLYKFKIITNIPQEKLDVLFDMYNKQTDSLVFLSAVYAFFDELFSLLEPISPSIQYSSVKKSIEFIEEHFTESFNLDFLANLCGFSKSHFCTLFKEATGITPIEYKNMVLIKHASELISANMPIEQVSETLNFNSVSYFRRVFKNIMNMTPSKYRKSHRFDA